MTISTEKTKSILISKQHIRCEIVVHGQTIEQAMKVDYLDNRISSAGKIEEEVTLQVNKPNRAAGCLNDTLC